MNEDHLSLNDVERFFQHGYWSRERTVAFVRKWNEGPHFTQAVVTEGTIRNFDPERNHIWRHLYKECGVKTCSNPQF